MRTVTGSVHKSGRPRSSFGKAAPTPLLPSKYHTGLGSKATSTSSRHVRHLFQAAKVGGRQVEVLSQAQIRARNARENEEQEQRLKDMTTEQLNELSTLRTRILDFGNTSDDDLPGCDYSINVEDVLSGSSTVDLSHAGGELSELLAIEDDLFGPQEKRQRRDYRTRRDRAQRRTAAFTEQMPTLVDAYMAWRFEVGENGLDGVYCTPQTEKVQGESTITEVDIFRIRKVTVDHIEGDTHISSAIVRHGLLPCAPYNPHVAFTVRLLEFYRAAHNRCPHLSIHSFVKTMCDLHATPFKPYLSRQFSIAYDLYLEIRRGVDERIQQLLNRDSEDYRLKHVCPCCTYQLVDEPKLKFSMLYTVDGNDSLKRVIRREAPSNDQDGTSLILPKSSESLDNRTVGKGFYLTREQVDHWSLESIANMDNNEDAEDADYNPCSERWKNMKTDITAKMWGVFEESGIFVALCRHGFVLLLADMVRSGEQSKYALAVVDRMLSVHGKDLALGYDIGCRFATTLNRSPLGPQVKSMNHRCLVGAFHGHAHNRLCQSRNLATYVEGLGLEDLETCERFFSQSNALAGPTRHASIFHRRQVIAEYANYHDQHETFQNISTFLLNNYRQALAVLGTRPAVLAALEQVGGSPDIVHDWLAEENAYLEGLSREPLEETLEMEYYTLLVKLSSSEQALRAAEANWSVLTPSTFPGQDSTASTETARRHAIENLNKDLKAVQFLEKKMGIVQRWTKESPEWAETARKVSMRKYQRCLDALEGLIVARIFELSKMNMSQTGYSLRKHIASSLQSRSTAIRTALAQYNAVANEFTPPRRNLTWDEVVEYAFLADFDLLRDTRQDIRSRPWSTPAARLAMDSYFKLLRASEEMERLNIEVPRLATYIHDELLLLRAKSQELRPINRILAYHVDIYRMGIEQYAEHHVKILNKITSLKGFSGGRLIGTRKPVSQSPRSVNRTPTPPPPTLPMTVEDDLDEEEALEEEQTGEDEETAAMESYLRVLQISYDGT